MADSNQIVCDKTGEQLPGSLVNNFLMEFNYMGRSTQRYQLSLSHGPLEELEEVLASAMEGWLRGEEATQPDQEPEEIEGESAPDEDSVS